MYKINANPMKKITMIGITSLLLGCGEHTRVEISDEYVDMIGAWQTRHEDIQENSTHIDNMLLIINHEGDAVYRHCEIKKSSVDHNNKRFRYSTEFPKAIITSLTKKEISLYQKLFDSSWLGVDWDLSIDKPPYQSNGEWYLEIEGKQLRKLSPETAETEINWACPDSSEEDTDQQEQVLTV